MKCQTYFMGKNKKNVIKLSSAELAQSGKGSVGTKYYVYINLNFVKFPLPRKYFYIVIYIFIYLHNFTCI